MDRAGCRTGSRRRVRAGKRLPWGRGESKRHALAAAAFDRTEQRVPVDERADLAHEVAAARLFDLDHFGALLAEQSGAEPCGDARPEIEDTHAGERAGHFVCSPDCSCVTAAMPPCSAAAMNAP